MDLNQVRFNDNYLLYFLVSCSYYLTSLFFFFSFSIKFCYVNDYFILFGMGLCLWLWFLPPGNRFASKLVCLWYSWIWIYPPINDPSICLIPEKNWGGRIWMKPASCGKLCKPKDMFLSRALQGWSVGILHTFGPIFWELCYYFCGHCSSRCPWFLGGEECEWTYFGRFEVVEWSKWPWRECVEVWMSWPRVISSDEQERFMAILVDSLPDRCFMACARNIFSHTVSSWLSSCCWSLFDPQCCKYCWIHKMPQRCEETDPAVCLSDDCIKDVIYDLVCIQHRLSSYRKMELIQKLNSIFLWRYWWQIHHSVWHSGFSNCLYNLYSTTSKYHTNFFFWCSFLRILSC